MNVFAQHVSAIISDSLLQLDQRIRSVWLGRIVVSIVGKTCRLLFYFYRETRNGALPLLRWSIVNQHSRLSLLFAKVVFDIDRHQHEKQISCLQLACAHGQEHVVKRLLQKKANVNLESCFNHYSPLFWAVYQNHEKICRVLLENGANPNTITDDRSPLVYALSSRQLKLADILCEHKADPNIGYKSEQPSSSIEQTGLYYFLDSWCYVQSVEDRRYYLAYLLDRGADPNQGYMRAENRMGTCCKVMETPLHKAVVNTESEDYSSVVELLLKRGADPNKGYLVQDFVKQSWSHRTPLNQAVISNLTRCVKLLLEHGALPNYTPAIRDDSNWNLYLAVKNNNTEIVELLLNHGADAREGGQKLIWASQSPAMKELLNKYGAKDNGESQPMFWVW